MYISVIYSSMDAQYPRAHVCGSCTVAMRGVLIEHGSESLKVGNQDLLEGRVLTYTNIVMAYTTIICPY
jgi:hypothetical protein